MNGTIGETSVEGGYLNLSLHSNLEARIYVPPPFWEDRYRDSVREIDEYFSDNAGNSYVIYIWSAMGDISYDIEVTDITNQAYYEDFKDNVEVEFDPIIPVDYEELQAEYDSIEEEETNSRFFVSFLKELEKLKSLNEKSFDDINEDYAFRKMIYVNIVTLLEVYLGDVFKVTIADNQDYLKLAIEKVRELSSEKIPLKDFLQEQYTPLSYTEKVINNKILFHKLEKVNELYKAVFGISILDNSSKDIIDMVQIRHDFVHRNKSVKYNTISSGDISNAIEKVRNFLSDIDNKIYDKISKT